MIRVLLVDDQALIRVGFRTILESEPGIEVVGEAANCEEGITMAQELAPDVICMDVQMPKLDGILGDGAGRPAVACGALQFRPGPVAEPRP